MFANIFSLFHKSYMQCFISYNGNVRMVHRQCTNGTWLMYEKESLSPALSQGNESPSPTLPQGKGALNGYESQIVNRLIV